MLPTMRAILSLWLVLACSATLLGQSSLRQRQIDSLRTELDRPQQDTTRYALLTKLGFLYYDGSLPDSAIAIAERAKAIAHLLGDAVRISDACFLIGTTYRAQLATYDKGLEYFFLGLTHLENARSHPKYLVKRARLLTEIALSYESLEDFEQAIAYCIEIRQIARENGFKFYEAIAAATESSIRRLMGDYDAAMVLTERTLVLRREIGDSAVVARSIGTVGEILYLKGKPLNALPQLFKSLEMLNGEIHNTVRAYNNIARCYLAIHMLDSAAIYAQKGYDLCVSTRRKFGLQQCYKIMADIKERQGQFEEALFFQKRYNELRDTVLSGQRRQRAATLQMRAAIEEKEREQERALKQQFIVQNVLLSILGVLTAAIFVVALAYRQKQKSEQALQEKNALIEKQNRQLETQRDDLAEANKLKSELLAIAAHDLKNPLQSVVGFASLIEEKVEPQSEFAQMSRFIKQSADKMLRLINDLLDTTVMQMGRMKLRKASIDVGKLIEDVVDDHLAAAQRKNQTIEVTTDKNAVASVDEERMRQVLSNLISNAIKYSPTGKTIYVETKKTGIRRQDTEEISTLPPSDSCILISVRDEGKGLTESDKAKLFQQFQRLSAQPTGGESSTGLGLWIAKEIVELHGGKIWAESKGNGSTFFVELPALPVAKPISV